MKTLKAFGIGVLASFSLFLLWGGVALTTDPYSDGWIIGAPIAIIGGGLAVVSARLLVDHFKK